MATDLGKGWTASNGGYTVPACQHGEGKQHTIVEALHCGMLRAVRETRGFSRETAARQAGVSTAAWCKWELELATPRGLYLQAVERWVNGQGQ